MHDRYSCIFIPPNGNVMQEFVPCVGLGCRVTALAGRETSFWHTTGAGLTFLVRRMFFSLVAGFIDSYSLRGPGASSCCLQ